MASQRIEYIWKVARPKNEVIARGLISYIHPTTCTRGRFVTDRPHITVSVKNPVTEQARKHQTSHGYTPHINSFEIVEVSPASGTRDDVSSLAWPEDADSRPRETIEGPPALLGPKNAFITWPSEETGE
ncbi:Uncharacterized protein TPAR_07104 [Tolypocladium paradoxum]|uniref:Uncharacterized protein n=1 Tax=Tolypocladium paradoxum TaxID=94208 RepID=A0A2S4KR88_9HYPO|nr:Uncharacterized protein TPAR_07104 [Tolypocladium paradoxum]